jgi:hypothetical protein
MTAWITPPNFAVGALSEASLDNLSADLTWLKNFADLTTNTTAADSGTVTYMAIKRTSAGEVAYRTNYGADGDYRWRMLSDGKQQWGTGAGVENFNLQPGSSALALENAQFNIYRANVNENFLGMRRTSDSQLRVQFDTNASGDPRMGFGGGASAADAFIKRKSAGILQVPTGTQFEVQGNAATDVIAWYQVGSEAVSRLRILGSGEHKWTDGTTNENTANLYRANTGVLKTDGRLIADQGLVTLIETAGVMSDARFAQSPQNGTVAINASGATPRIAVRHNGAWYGVTTTAGG